MFSWYRRSINPPYSIKDLPAIFGTFFVLLIPAAVLLSLVQTNYFQVNERQGLQSKSEESFFIFSASGDFGANSNTKQVLEKIADSASEFHLALGDLSYSTLTPESAWCDFVKSQVGTTFPFQLVSGNHEDDGPDGDINKFAACLPNRITGVNGDYAKEYYFDYKKLARFILISPNLNIDGELYEYKAGDMHYKWLAEAIDDAKKENIPWLIVGMHKNCISMGVKLCEIGSDLMKLLMDKKVDLVLQGHEHNYQRSKQLKCASVGSYQPSCVVNDGEKGMYKKGQGTIFVIAGTGGKDLTSVARNDSEAGYFSRWSGKNTDPTYGIVRFIVYEKQIFAKFVSLIPDQFSDSFVIEGQSGIY